MAGLQPQWTVSPVSSPTSPAPAAAADAAVAWSRAQDDRLRELRAYLEKNNELPPDATQAEFLALEKQSAEFEREGMLRLMAGRTPGQAAAAAAGSPTSSSSSSSSSASASPGLLSSMWNATTSAVSAASSATTEYINTKAPGAIKASWFYSSLVATGAPALARRVGLIDKERYRHFNWILEPDPERRTGGLVLGAIPIISPESMGGQLEDLKAECKARGTSVSLNVAVLGEDEMDGYGLHAIVFAKEKDWRARFGNANSNGASSGTSSPTTTAVGSPASAAPAAAASAASAAAAAAATTTPALVTPAGVVRGAPGSDGFEWINIEIPDCTASGLSYEKTMAVLERINEHICARNKTVYCHCLAKDDMELLSDTGFIGYAEARRRYDAGTLVVAGYDQKTRQIIYEKPSHFIDRDGAPDDGMYEFKERVTDLGDGNSYGNGYSIKVTGNHQILMQCDEHTPWGVMDGRSGATKLFGLGPVKATVKQLTGEARSIVKMNQQQRLMKWPAGMKTVDANGKHPFRAQPRTELDDDGTLYYVATAVNGFGGVLLRDCIDMAALVPAWSKPRLAGRLHDRGDEQPDLVAPHQAALEVAMCELLGFWLGDGSLSSGAKMQTAYVCFSQTKDSDVAYIKRRLDLLGLKLNVDYVRTHYAATSTDAKRTVFWIKRRSWVELFYGEFACKYMGGMAKATELGVGASAAAAWRREFNTPPPTDEQIKLRAIDYDDDYSDSDDNDDDVNVNRPLGTPLMGLKDGGATKTTTTTIIYIIKSAKWFWRWVWRLGRAHAFAIITGLMEADGCGGIDNEKETNWVWTSSVAFRDQLVRLAIHAGRNPKYARAYAAGTNRGTSKSGRPIIAKHDSWRVTFSIPRSCASPIFCRKDIVKIDDYNAGVWCVTMPHTGNIVVRRKQTDPAKAHTSYRPVVIGNCKAGKGRSWLMVNCYLIAFNNMSASQAMAYVKSKRHQVSPSRTQEEFVEAFYRNFLLLEAQNRADRSRLERLRQAGALPQMRVGLIADDHQRQQGQQEETGCDNKAAAAAAAAAVAVGTAENPPVVAATIVNDGDDDYHHVNSRVELAPAPPVAPARDNKAAEKALDDIFRE